MTGIIIFGFGPLLYAAIYYFSDIWLYLNTGETDEIMVWQVNNQYSQLHVLFLKLVTDCSSPQRISFIITAKFCIDLLGASAKN
jgi:hypothetical protein